MDALLLVARLAALDVYFGTWEGGGASYLADLDPADLPSLLEMERDLLTVIWNAEPTWEQHYGMSLTDLRSSMRSASLGWDVY